MELPFASLAELVDFPLHILDVGDLVVALLRFLCFGVGAERWGIELLVQGVDFIKRLLIGLCAIVIFFLSRVFGIIDFRFSVLGLAAFLERALHIDSSDFKSALGKSHDRKRERESQGHREKFFHKREITVVGTALDCNYLYSFKIDSPH